MSEGSDDDDDTRSWFSRFDANFSSCLLRKGKSSGHAHRAGADEVVGPSFQLLVALRLSDLVLEVVRRVSWFHIKQLICSVPFPYCSRPETCHSRLLFLQSRKMQCYRFPVGTCHSFHFTSNDFTFESREQGSWLGL